MEGESDGSEGEHGTGNIPESGNDFVCSKIAPTTHDDGENKDKNQEAADNGEGEGQEACESVMVQKDAHRGDSGWGWRRGEERNNRSGEWSGMEWRTENKEDGCEIRGGFRGFSMSRRGGRQASRYSEQDRSTRYSGQDRSTRYSGQDRSTRYSGQDRSTRYSGQDRSTRYSGQDRSRHHIKFTCLGTKETMKERTFSYQKLEELSKKDPSEVAVSVSSHPALKPLLSECTMKKDLVELLCLVLSKAFRSRADRGTLQHLAGIIKDSGFLRTVLPHYLAAVGSEFDADCRDEYPQHLDNILAILTQVLSIFPASSVESVHLLLTLLRPSLNSLRTSGVDVPSQIEKDMEHLQHLVRHLQTKSRDGTKRSNKDTYALLTSADEDQQDFRNIPIYPTPEELRQEDRPYLRPNLTSQRYPSTHLYLDTHFRLLREDFVRPLREGIQELLRTQMNIGQMDIGQMDNAGNQVTKRLDDIRIYHGTKVIAPKCTMNGLAYIVQFNVEPLKFVRWENSKRLIFGSLVCLSCDNFESFLFATISNRDPKELQEGRVQIIFTEESRDQLAKTQQNQVYLMVETTAYFEAYRYVLEGLKEQKEDELPFKNYLVDCSPDVESPEYLRRDDTYDLSSVAHPDFKLEVEPFHCLDAQAWPTMEELGLDESQFRAFQLALTKELAIIQGPPGTGKTYVGLKIAQALLKNTNLWNSPTNKTPILIVCYTNHALDQFLEGIHTFLKDGIVRVGSRSSSEILKRFNLRELSHRYDFRERLPDHLITPYNAISREVHDAETVLESHSVKMECTFKGLMHDSVLQEFMSEQHWKCLHAVRKKIAFKYVGKKLSVILEWLGLESLQETQTDAPSNTQDMQANAVKKQPEGRLIHIDEQANLLEAERDIDDEIYFKGRRDDHRRGHTTHIVEKSILVMSLDESEKSAEHDDEQSKGRWEYQAEQKKKLKNKIKQELKKESTMTEEEERLNSDVWKLTVPDRLWVDRYRVKCRTKAFHPEEVYQNAVDRLADVKRQQDLCLLRNAKVIGMTTTGAAKFRHMLQQVRPSLVIVEEAAEVLEAHTITTLSSACQHLILIGDHQQLRPSATVFELAKNFNMEMSMFERLVNMELPFVRLNYQHRMRPDIARLLTPHIYSELENHPSVLEYDNIKGLNSNLFFVEHTYPEEELKDGKSHQNQHEAQFVVALCRYLILQEYKPEQITILTTYTGQLFCLRKLMPASLFSGVKVQVVDKYQGEENDIVLLSLVRSNMQGRVGFLSIPNRVCVALSRAKKGLYCIGNSEMLGQVKLWSKIFHTLREKDQLGTALTLCCQNHPDRQVTASSAADFQQAPEGGCTLPCEFRLDCGHVCTKVCHPADPEHKKYQCMKKCQKILCDLGHGCVLLCYETCGDCKVLVEKTIPRCQHKQMVPCFKDPERFVCQEPCPKTLECGHPCESVCGEPCTYQCKVKVHFDLKCGHNKNDFCYYKVCKQEPDCTVPCKQQLKCGHVCRGNCSGCHQGRYHCSCSHECERLLVCSHICQAPCTNCPPCTRKCQNCCVHSQCPRRCGQPCSPCVEPCAWRCPHQSCTKLCHEPCDRPPCDEPCDNVLYCGHPCIGLCGEKCPDKCRVCHHEEVTEIFFGFEDDPEARFIQLQDCGHVIERRAMDQYMGMDEKQQENEEEVAIKLKECPKCRTPIRKNLRYGSHINRCLAEIELVKEKIAGNQEDIKSQTLALLKLWKENKHKEELISHYFLLLTKKVKLTLESDLLSAVDLWIVENKISFFTRVAKLLVIRKKHHSATDCVTFNDRIVEFLGWLKDPHQRFTEQQMYDLERELRRLTLLAELYAHSNMAELKGLKSNIQMEEQTLQYILGKCDPFTEDDESRANQIIEEVKKKFPLSGLGISDEERKMIVSAIQMPGHWFKCPNGHVYVIGDCGGATESRKCPECNAVIGGASHRVASGNQLATEMDGAQTPAWPTALGPQ